MKALVLGGGGAKGSYEVGVWKALNKLNMKFDIVTGVSIGSINGAFYVANEYKKCLKMWRTITTNDLFDVAIGSKLSKEDLQSLVKQMSTGGISFANAEKFLKKNINEEKVRKSKINYGLVTVSLTNKKPRFLTKEQIPYGKLVDYICASSICYPFVHTQDINDESFIDGGFYDGIPINLAIDMGATEIVAVDLSVLAINKKPKDKNVKVDVIKMKDKTPLTLTFTKEYADKNNYNIVGIYNDAGYSGKNLMRPEMQRLLKDIEDGKIDILLAIKTDRLTRDGYDGYWLLHQCDKYNVRIELTLEPFDISTANGEMMFGLNLAFGQRERKEISARTKRGLEQMAIEHKHPNKPPYGYTRDPITKHLEIEPIEAEVVKDIFNMSINGIPYRQIAEKMRNENRYLKRGKWSDSRVCKILDNEIYIGTFRFGKYNRKK